MMYKKVNTDGLRTMLVCYPVSFIYCTLTIDISPLYLLQRLGTSYSSTGRVYNTLKTFRRTWEMEDHFVQGKYDRTKGLPEFKGNLLVKKVSSWKDGEKFYVYDKKFSCIIDLSLILS